MLIFDSPSLSLSLFLSLSLSLPPSPSSLPSQYMSTESQRMVGGVLVGTGLWVGIIFVMRNTLKCLLSWHGWMHASRGSVNWTTRLWMVNQLRATCHHLAIISLPALLTLEFKKAKPVLSVGLLIFSSIPCLIHRQTQCPYIQNVGCLVIVSLPASLFLVHRYW